MLTYERYQALRVIHIRVQGEPGNEATKTAQGGFRAGSGIRNLKALRHYVGGTSGREST